MRKIVRKPSCDICPSGFIWIVYVGNGYSSQNATSFGKMIFPAGTKKSEIESLQNEMGLRGSIHIVEVSI